MPKYSVDVWGTGPKPENFQIEAEDKEEAENEARSYSTAVMITNVEVSEMASY